ncbi:MAG: S16 family serine protease [Trebonia sp.]
MFRRSLTLTIAGIATLIAIAVAVLVPVPYVILLPGPTLNTLGNDPSGQPLIKISGHQTYPTTGHLNMVTVGFNGGPGVRLNIFQALRGWLSPTNAVVPEAEIFPPGQSAQQTHTQDIEQMASSQETATAAALTELHIPYQTVTVVISTHPGYPASTVLKAGDVIEAVNGKPVTGPASLSSAISAHPAGSELQLTVLREGQTLSLQVATKDSGGKPIIGIEVQQQYKFPFTVTIDVGNIGGPSAGMMVALGIIDMLTSDNLTGGKFIAGTGEITPAGQVQPIGGIQQKMAAARSAGATVFLTPSANCANTAGAVPAGLRLAKVSTLSQAVSDLEALKAGKSVPSC